MTLPYPPPWQDASTLCAHICISERTIENWVTLGILPPARLRGGKRMWRWSEVERYLEGIDETGQQSSDAQANRIREATRAAASS